MATFIKMMLNHEILIKTLQVIKISFRQFLLPQEHTIKVVQIMISDNHLFCMHVVR